jgi:hypothetical protein
MTDPQASSDARLEAIFNNALKEAVKKEPRPQIEAHFYPYAGLSSTIRLRRGRVYVRVSDILIHSPSEIIYALARILIAKLYRIKVSREHQRIYREYTSSDAIRDASEATRRTRGYKLTSSPLGRAYDLDELFNDLNGRYFDSELEKPLLSWSLRPTRRVFGHHDPTHGTIVISRTLDDVKVPRIVVEYVLYHEMLHIKHPPKTAGGRTIYHDSEFRADEQRFEGYQKALATLERVAIPQKRMRTKRRRRPLQGSRGTKTGGGR